MQKKLLVDMYRRWIEKVVYKRSNVNIAKGSSSIEYPNSSKAYVDSRQTLIHVATGF